MKGEEKEDARMMCEDIMKQRQTWDDKPNETKKNENKEEQTEREQGGKGAVRSA